jgi:hypothetical protein
MIFVTLAILIVASVGFYVQDRPHRATLNNAIGAYENSLAWERTRVDNLVVQIQANAQGFNHMPQLGPFDPPPERQFVRDETGLVEYELTDEDLADFETVAG